MPRAPTTATRSALLISEPHSRRAALAPRVAGATPACSAPLAADPLLTESSSTSNSNSNSRPLCIPGGSRARRGAVEFEFEDDDDDEDEDEPGCAPTILAGVPSSLSPVEEPLGPRTKEYPVWDDHCSPAGSCWRFL